MAGPSEAAKAADRNDSRTLGEATAPPVVFSADNPLGVRHRRRFIANPQPKTEAIEAAPIEEEVEVDFPVLTEEVGVEADLDAERLEKAMSSILASDMAYAIEQHLAIELPKLIETALLNSKEELRMGVNETVALALRNFLARRQPLVPSPPDGLG
jgi:hypothetical protein